MKRFTLVLLGLGVTGAAVANGAYVGARLGTDNSHIKYQLLSSGAQARLNEDEPLVGINGGVYAGYRFSLSKDFYAGLEASYVLSNSEFEFSDPLAGTLKSYRYRVGPSLGVSGLSGFNLNSQASVFGLFGWSYTRFKREADAAHVTSFGHDFNQYQSGYQLGLGQEVSLSGPLSFRLEYRYHHYCDIKNKSGAGSSVTYKPSSNDTLMAVSYYFDRARQDDVGLTSLAMNSIFINAGLSRVNTEIEAYAKDGNDNESWPHGLSGFVGDLGLGYGKLLGDFYFGEEIFMHLGKVDMNYNHLNNGRNFKLHNDFGYGLSIFPGYRLSPSNIVFSRIGWAYSQFKKTGGVVAANNLGPNFKRYDSGLEMGLGIETAITAHVSLVTEYDYTTYRAIKNSLSGTNFEYKPADDKFTLGANYRF
jgi:opacity protein-like surface antigen